MLTRYGFGAIHIDDKQYKISPTFQNIDKLGTPKEIIKKTDLFFTMLNPPRGWLEQVKNYNIKIYKQALEVLQSCCEPKLPSAVTGRFKERADGTVKIINPPSADFMHDVIVLASHCLKYGVVGVTDSESTEEGEPISEFDVYHFIGLACEHLGRTREQAADMTLTEFMMAWDIKFPEQKKARQERLSKLEQKRLFDYQDELDKKAAQKRAAKQAKQ